MRLALVSAKYPYGVKEPYLDTELRALAPRLDGLVVVPTSPPRRRGYAGVPGEVVRVPLLAASTLVQAALTTLRHPRRVAAVVAALAADRYPLRVKLKNLAVVPKALAVAGALRRRRVDHVHAYWLSTPATVAWIAARVLGVPFSVTAHRWDVYENNLAARKVREARFVRTISERGRRDLLAATGGDPAKVRVVRLGVALPRRARVPVAAGGGTAGEPGPLRILCAAALVPVKGHVVLLDALARLRGRGVAFRCTLAGDGPLRDEIRAAIVARGLADAVELAGTIPHDALLAELCAGAFDVSVIASIERPGGLMEGVPVALIEAMAAGAVVVATDSGSVGELVDGETGLLVPHSDPEALASALERVAREPALRERLRGEARARVERDFDVARTTEALGELLALGAPAFGLAN